MFCLKRKKEGRKYRKMEKREKRGMEERKKKVKGKEEKRKERRKYIFFYILPLCIGCLKSYNHIQKQALLPECSTGRLMELTISS